MFYGVLLKPSAREIADLLKPSEDVEEIEVGGKPGNLQELGAKSQGYEGGEDVEAATPGYGSLR